MIRVCECMTMGWHRKGKRLTSVLCLWTCFPAKLLLARLQLSLIYCFNQLPIMPFSSKQAENQYQ